MNMTRLCIFSFQTRAPKHQHIGALTVIRDFLSPSSHLKSCEDPNSLWLGIPFGFTLHGEVLIEGESNERAGRLSCDGGQLLNWATNRPELNPDRSFQTEILIRFRCKGEEAAPKHPGL